MAISAKKKKHIKRHYRKLSTRQIASELKIKEKEVKEVIREIEGSDSKAHGEKELINKLDKVIEFGVYLLVALSPLVFIKFIHQFSVLPKTAFSEIIVVLLFALWIFKIIVQKKLIFRKTPLLFPLLTYFTLVTFSLFWAVNPFESLNYILYLFVCILLFLIVKENMDSLERIKRVFYASLVGGVMIAFIGIYQYFTGFDWIPQHASPSATFGNRNFAAQYLIMVMPLSLAPLYLGKSYFAKASSLLAFLAMGFYLLLTQARGAWTGLAFGVLFGVVVFFFTRGGDLFKEFIREKKNAYLLASATIAVIFIILVMSFSQIGPLKKVRSDIDLINQIKSITQLGEKNIKARIDVWKNTWEMAKDHFFFGVGIENYKSHYLRYSNEVVPTLASLDMSIKRAHNDYLQALAEIGIFGLILYLSIMAVFFYMIWFVLRNPIDKEMRLLAISIAIGLSAFLVHSFFSFPNRRPVPLLFSFLFFGICAVLYERSRSSERIVVELKGKKAANIAKTILFGFLLFFVLITTLNVRFIMADFHAFICKYYSDHEKNDLGYEEAKRMNSLYPYFFKYWIIWGSANSKLGKYDEAIEINNKALKHDPYRFQLLNNQGGNYFYKGEYGKAEEYFKKILAINPYVAKAHKNLGMVYYFGFKDHEKALFHLKESLRLDPDIEEAEKIRATIMNLSLVDNQKAEE